jgi:hypothetical protein
LRQAVRSAESAVASITQSYELSLRTSFEVLLAQRDLFRARRDLVGARYDYILGVLRLKRAAGTLAAPDLAKVNAWLEASASTHGKPASRLSVPDKLSAPAPRLQRNPGQPAADGEGIVLKRAASLLAPGPAPAGPIGAAALAQRRP